LILSTLLVDSSSRRISLSSTAYNEYYITLSVHSTTTNVIIYSSKTHVCRLTSVLYTQSSQSSVSCVHCCTISHFSITTIVSACITVCNLCAIMTTVLPFVNSCNALVIACSETLSNADVGSSRIRIRGFLRKTLAIARRCFSHQDNFTHFSPSCVSSHKDNQRIISAIDAFSNASRIASSFISASL
jgi:hypothetical protein